MGYIVLNVRTRSADGIYSDYPTAERMKKHHTAKWVGSVWSVHRWDKDGLSEDNFHDDEPARARLLEAYGPENWTGCDRVDKEKPKDVRWVNGELIFIFK